MEYIHLFAHFLYFCPQNTNENMQFRTLLFKKFIVTVFAAFVAVSGAFGQANVHVVKQGETLYRLSVIYGVTVEQILNANPGLTAQSLQAGSSVKIPASSLAFVDGESQTSVQSQAKSVTPQSAHSVSDASEIRMAMILPVAEKGLAGGRALEYYRGFLLAAQDCKEQGHKVTIYTYEEPNNQSTMQEVLQKLKQNQVKFLVGPLYLSHFADVVEFAKTEGVKVLIPFSSKVDSLNYNPNIFMLNTPSVKKNEILANLFTKQFDKADTRVIFVGEEIKGNEQGFTNYLKEQLTKQEYTIGELPVDFNIEDLHAYSRAGCTSVIVPTSSSAPMFKNVTKLIKAYRTEYPKSAVALFGYSDWQGAAKDYRQDLHLSNTYLVTNAFCNQWSTETKRFMERYKYWFKQDLLPVTPSMAILGYDSGMYFLHGIARYGNKLSTQDINASHLQSDFRFEPIAPEGALADSNFWFIHYRTDGAIEKVEVQ